MSEDMKIKKSVWGMTFERLDQSINLLSLSDGLKKYLREPRKVLEVAVTVKMDSAFYEVYGISKNRKVDMRKAANILGIGKVAQAVKLRGIYP